MLRHGHLELCPVTFMTLLRMTELHRQLLQLDQYQEIWEWPFACP